MFHLRTGKKTSYRFYRPGMFSGPETGADTATIGSCFKHFVPQDTHDRIHQENRKGRQPLLPIQIKATVPEFTFPQPERSRGADHDRDGSR
jgi:hypothetical protein